jgi:hypothetical protein
VLPCRGLDGDTVLGERRAGGVHSGCDRGGLKPFTTSHTPSENSQAATGRKPTASTVIWWSVRKKGCDDRGDEYWGSGESYHGNDTGHEAGPVHQGAQQQCVDARHEGLSEQERPVVDRDVRRAGGGKRGRICSGRSA